MSDYTKLVDYAAKDLLLHNDPAKAVKGTEVGAEFDAIATMSATKVDKSGGTFTGLINLAAGANIASAATIDLTAATGNCPRITGTTATSAVTMNTGQQMFVVADGAWPLTYHATTNKITGGADTVLAAGDHVLYHKDLSGVVSGIIYRANAGEVVTSYVGATAFAGANVYSDHTSITVTPGRWLIGVIASVNKGASDATETRFGIGTVTGNNAANLTIGDTYFDLVPSATGVVTGVVPSWYASVAVTTTFYLKRRAVYTTGTPDSYGRITARRI